MYNDGGIWSILDYATAYDPCVCQAASRVYVETSITEKQSVELSIDGSSSTEPIVQAGQPVSAAQRGFGIASNILGTAGSGIASFGNVQKYNTEAAAVKAKQGKEAMLTIASNLVPGWIGAGKSVVDLLKLFIGSEGTSSRIVGYTTAYELEASGEITTTEYGNPSEFNTPASLAQTGQGFQTGSNSVYGNPLGVFNLVKTPEVTRRVNNNASATGKTIDEYYSIDGNDLKYVINTSAGFLPIPRRIMMSLVFEDCIGEPRFMRLMPASTGGSIRTPFTDARCFENQYANFYSKFTQSGDPNDPFGGGGGLEFEEYECTRRYLQVLVTLIPADGSPDVVYMGSYEVKDGQTINVSSEQPFSGYINDQPASSSCPGSIVQPITNSALQSFCTSEYNARRVDPRSQPMPLMTPGPNAGSIFVSALPGEATEISFAPNPFRDRLTITSDEAIETVEVFNGAGQRVFSSQALGDSRVGIPLSHLQAGVYTVKVLTPSGVETKLITKI